MKIFLFILLTTTSLYSQITVTSNDLLGVKGNSAVFVGDSSGSINVFPGPSGENQVWNFSSVVLESNESSVIYTDPQNTPYPTLFPGSNFIRVQRETIDTTAVGYGYYDINPTAIQFFGFAIEVDTAVFQETDEDITPLPLNYGDNWTKVTNDTLNFEGFLMITRDSTYSEVDAWGTITLPGGSYQSLRIRDNSTAYSMVVIGGFVVSADTSTSISYDWVTKNNFAVAFIQSHDGETNANFSNASEMEMLKSTEPTAISDQRDAAYINSFKLFQNYPNPFNPETRIDFQLSQSEHVRIDVFGLAGKWVTTLLNGPKSAGMHYIGWNGKNIIGVDVASGVYYYVLNIAGKKVQSRKMILIR